MEGFLKQSTAVNITVLLVSSTDHIAGKTGATLTIYATKAAGTPASISPTVTELDSTNAPGLYKLALTTSHTDTLGELQLHITATGADPADYKWQVSSYLPGEAVTLQADQAVNVTKFGGTTVTARDIGASVLLSNGTGTGQVSLSSGAVTIGTNNDKTGYALSSAGVQAIWDALTSALTTVGSIGKLLVDNINATISSRLASASYTAPLDAAGVRSAVGLASANLDTQLAALPTAAENADAVWEEAIADHSGTAGSTAEALNSAGSAGDPWSTALPGAYAAGSAGYIVGTNLDATVSSRASSSALATAQTDLDTITGADGVTLATAQANYAPAKAGNQMDLVNAPNATAITAIQAGLSTLNAAGVRSAVGLASANLDTQLAALPTAAENAAAVWDEDATGHQTQGTFGQAIGDPGADTDTIFGLVNTNLDAAVSTRLASASYTAPLDAAGTRAAVGLASANLDTQLTAIDDAVDTEVAAIKAKTDQLTFTVAGQVDANIQSINDTALTGDGSATPWGPV